MNKIIKAIEFQWNHLFLKLMIIFTAFLLLVFSLYLISSYFDIPFNEFTNNPYAFKDSLLFTGILQKAGMVLWITSAAICFFTVYLRKDREKFFLFAGAISSLFALDELLLLHSKIIPLVYLISQNFVYIIYGILVTIFLVKYRDRILRSEFIILYSSLFFLSLKIIIDGFQNNGSLGETNNFYIEDSAKLIGIFLWFYYFTRFAFFKIRDKKRDVFISTKFIKTKPDRNLTLKKERGAD